MAYTPLGRFRCCERVILLPTPRVPNADQVESQPDHDQEFVIQRWVSWQADGIEEEEKDGDDDMRPAVSRLIQNQGEKDHQDGNEHHNCNTQPHALTHALSHDLAWFEVAAEDAQDIAEQVGQHQARPQGSEFDLNVFHLFCRLRYERG